MNTSLNTLDLTVSPNLVSSKQLTIYTDREINPILYSFINTPNDSIVISPDQNKVDIFLFNDQIDISGTEEITETKLSDTLKKLINNFVKDKLNILKLETKINNILDGFYPQSQYNLHATPVTTNSFFYAIYGPNNNTLYFLSNVGIFIRNNETGEIKVENVIESFQYNNAIIYLDLINNTNTLYFNGNNNGIKFLNNETGEITSTNKTTGTVYCSIIEMTKNILYFLCNDNVYYLNVESNSILVLPNSNKGFTKAVVGPYDTVYFFSNNKNIGIWYLDTLDNQIKQTNITTGTFNDALFDNYGSNFYFLTNNNTGIWYLSFDDMLIYQTNIKTNNFISGYTASNNTFFFKENSGILAYDGAGGISQTNITTGNYKYAFTVNNIIYFLGNLGIMYLNPESGLIQQTNLINKSFNYGFYDNKYGIIYFLSDSGIYYTLADNKNDMWLSPPQ
jgi:hypothetical protein